MSLFRIVKRKVRHLIYGIKETDAATGYNAWALLYDEQTDNLLIQLDEAVFTSLLDKIVIANKVIVDIGCGTGRHWKKILVKAPSALIGYDVSPGMLNRLAQKFPAATTYLLKDNSLKELPDASCDIVISTLVVGYLKEPETAFAEWNRVLRTNGEIIITDFHPVALQGGASRSFKQDGKVITIKNYIHSLDNIRRLANKMNWNEQALVERKVDERVKHFYEQHNVLHAYENAYGTPLLYGLYFRKQ